MIANVVADLRHLRPGQLQRGDVREHDTVVFLQPGDVLRDSRRIDDGDLDVLRAQRRGERGGVRAVTVGEQHLRATAYDDRADGAVVVLDGVTVDVERRLIHVDAALIERLAIREHVLAGGEVHDLRAEELAVAEQRQPPLRVLQAPRHDLGLERLAVLHLLRQEHRLRHDLLRKGHGRRHVEDVRARVLGRLGAGQRVARVLAAVGEHDDAVGVARRHGGERELDRLEDIRAAPADGHLGAIDGRAIGQRLIDDRFLAEHDHLMSVAALEMSNRLAHEAIGALARHETHAVGVIEQEHDVETIHPARQRRPQQRHEQHDDQRPAQRQRPLIAGHRGDTEPPARLSAPVEHALQRQQRRGDEDEQGPELALDRHGR